MKASQSDPSAILADRAGPTHLATRLRAFAAGLTRRMPHFRGKERAVRTFEACLQRVFPNPQVLHVTVDGVTFALQTEDLIDYRIAYLSAHDGPLVRQLDGIIGGRNAVLWDVGANVGAISLPLAQRHPDLSIEAFEPSPAVVARLRRNLALNSGLAARIRLHEAALCDRVGQIAFYPSSEPENSGVGTLMPGPNTEATSVCVTAQTGDALIASGTARPPDVIKIDVEGFEYEVLCGLRQHLTQRRDLVVIFEHEPYRLRDREHAGSAVDLITSLGFTLFGLTRRAEVKPFSPRMLEEHIDILACGPSSAFRTPQEAR